MYKYRNDAQDGPWTLCLHKKSNTSLHLIAPIVQSVGLTPTKL